MEIKYFTFKGVDIRHCCPKCGDPDLFYNREIDYYYCKNCHKLLCYGDLDVYEEDREDMKQVIPLRKGDY